MPSLAPWQGVTPVFLGNPGVNGVNAEPSGLAIYTNGGTKWIFLVSDNGIVAKASLPSASAPTAPLSWLANPSPGTKNKAYDYECVTYSTANGSLLVGVEGDSAIVTNPLVDKFSPTSTTSANPAGAFVDDNQWTLQGIDFASHTNKGMEALELIPTGYFPSTWGGDVDFGGIFFAAVQAQYGKMYVYTLTTTQYGDVPLQTLNGPSNPLTIPAVRSAGTGATPKVSDLCFTGGNLYVLYGGGNDASHNALKHDYLQKLTISTSASATTTSALTGVGDYELPWIDSGGRAIGCEGLAIDGDDLYIAVDSGSSPSLNGVYVLPAVMRNLSWT